MLRSLIVKNFAIIEQTELHFSDRLNIISGETGSGKSILLKALGAILGEKNVTDYIRKGTEQAEIQACFSISKEDEIYKILSEKEMLHDDDETTLYIRKVIKPKNTTVWINDRASSNSFLSQISSELVQALSQNQQQKLTQASEQLKLIDESIEQVLFTNLQTNLSELRSLDGELTKLKKDATYKEERLSYLEHLLKDFHSFDLSSDDKELEDKISLIENSQFLMEELSVLEDLIYNEGILDKVVTLKRRLQKTTTKVNNESLLNALNKSEELLGLVDEIGSILTDNKENLNVEPEEISELLDKAKVIKKLKQKYGSLEQIKVQISKLEDEKEYLDSIESLIKNKESNKNKILKECLKFSEQISTKRKTIAQRFETDITKELQTLNMKGASIKVDFATQELNSLGTDKVTFLISSNKGEDFKPLAQIASGGELSRIMLAIHKNMSKEIKSCFLLDEVDQGISGDTGTIIGKKLSELSRASQVIAITHLPQVALFSDKHFLIEKKEIENQGRVISKSKELSQSEKEIELARMLGHSLNEKSALAHARELIKSKNK